MQPRYSPDGKRIAFTSDQGGGDNIWVMDRDGKNPRQVTKESFRLLNSPAWTPDGEYIAARKHFTATRSLGAGEIWLYHRSGGDGLQMVKRPNDQKDLGEPAFSPDGRYLYYSQDITPGRSSSTTRTRTAQIYVIQRLDRQTGETEGYITGPGGSIRPTPSPDGKRMAFIRRVRGKTRPPPHGPRRAASSGRSTTVSTATCRRPGRSTASIRAWPGRPTPGRSSSGPAARSGAWTRARRKVSDDPLPREDHPRRSSRPCALP